MAKDRNLRTRGFSVANMNDDFESAYETLVEAMSEQNPDINPDAFKMNLMRLVSDSLNTMAQSAYPAFASLIEASQDDEPRTIYNEAADKLILAHYEYKNGKKRSARDIFQDAMECADTSALMDALLMNNSRSDVGLQASEDIDTDDEDETTDLTPENEGEDDEPQIDLGTDPEDEEEDSSEPEDANPEEEVDAEEAKEKSDEDEDENEAAGMGKTVDLKEQLLKRAAANRMSQTGTVEARERAKKLIANG